MRTLQELVRPNIWNMKPYSSARDEFHGTASVFLDANENPYNTSINRYPDPMQWQLKEAIGRVKGIKAENIFLGNGSDEPIDVLIRVFCEPGKDNIVSIEPSYGMYEVAANINNVTFKKSPLDENFDVNVKNLLSLTDENTKLIYLCSPNNPTGNSLSPKKIFQIIENFDGIVIVDEAYHDFSSSESLMRYIEKYPNLVVLQTLSKAWGAAGVRLGMAFTNTNILKMMNKVKYPYNVNILTQTEALKLMENKERKDSEVAKILSERDHMEKLLADLPIVKKIYPSDANFLLVKFDDANKMYQYLVDNGIIVRNRTNVKLCNDCIRITIGTKKENEVLLEALKNYRS